MDMSDEKSMKKAMKIASAKPGKHTSLLYGFNLWAKLGHTNRFINFVFFFTRRCEIGLDSGTERSVGFIGRRDWLSRANTWA